MTLILVLAACAGQSVSDTGTTPTTFATCAELDAYWHSRYDELTADAGCSGDEDCWAPFGGCVFDLGGCQEAVNVRVSQEALDQIERRYRESAEAQGCDLHQRPCDCYGMYDAVCGVAGACELVFGSGYTR